MSRQVLNYLNSEKDFWWFIEERINITNRKLSNNTYPWSSDEILNKAYINNIKREDDTGTKVLINLIKKSNLCPILLSSIYRFSGSKINTLKALISIPEEKWNWFFKNSSFIQCIAYQNPAYPKEDGIVADFFNRVLPLSSKKLKTFILDGKYSIKELVDIYLDIICSFTFKEKKHKKYIFHANEIIKDLTYFFNIDKNSKCHIGPGAKKGLKILFKGFSEKDKVDLILNHDNFKKLKLSYCDLENCLCEFHKWVSYKQGKELRRVYKPKIEYYLNESDIENYFKKIIIGFEKNFNDIRIFDGSIVGNYKSIIFDLWVKITNHPLYVSIQYRNDYLGSGLGLACKKNNKKCVLFMASSKKISDDQLLSIQNGAIPFFKRVASGTNLNLLANLYSTQNNGLFLNPFYDDKVLLKLGEIFWKTYFNTYPIPKSVWLTIVSGFTYRCISKIIPSENINCLYIVGKKIPLLEYGKSNIVINNKSFNSKQDNVFPFNFDYKDSAKLTQYVKQNDLLISCGGVNIVDQNAKNDINSYRDWLKNIN